MEFKGEYFPPPDEGFLGDDFLGEAAAVILGVQIGVALLVGTLLFKHLTGDK